MSLTEIMNATAHQVEGSIHNIEIVIITLTKDVSVKDENLIRLYK